jgi:drug/metabolite transporter (DMT)-like permease
MTTLLYAVLSVIASGAGQLLLRRGAMAAPILSPAMAADPQTWAALLLNGFIVAGLVAWAFSTVLWIVVLNRAPLTYVYMLGSLNYVAVPLLSRWLFTEPISRMQLLGMGIIVVGVFLSLYGRAGAAS